MLKFVWMRLIVVSAAVVLLVGCGSSSDNTDTGAGTDATADATSDAMGDEAADASDDAVGAEAVGAGLLLSDPFLGSADGVELELSYDAGTNGFIGLVRNRSGAVRDRVEVVVSLGDGSVVLPPFLEVSLAVDEILPVSIPAGAAAFSSWDVVLRVQ